MVQRGGVGSALTANVGAPPGALFGRYPWESLDSTAQRARRYLTTTILPAWTTGPACSRLK